MSRRAFTSFSGPSLKELVAQGRYQGYIQALEHALESAETMEQGSFISSGCTLEAYCEILRTKIKEHRGKYQRRFHEPG